MKQIFNQIALVLLIAASISSCNDDFLQEAGPIDRFGNEIYEYESLMNKHVANLYYRYYSDFNSPDESLIGLYSNMPARITDERGGGVGSYKWIQAGSSYANGDDSMFPAYFGPNRLGTSVTNNSYDRIRYVTDIIENIDTKGANLPDAYRNGVKGQMLYLRAMQYYDLMRVFGGVPLITTVQTPSSEDPSIRIPRAKTGEIVAQIVKDLDEAATLLPAIWEDPAKNYGRPTSCAALAQKTRVLLVYASPLFNANWEDASKWQNVVDAGLEAEAALNASGHGLHGNSAKDWEDMLGTADYISASNKEAIAIQLMSAPEGTTSSTYSNQWENSLRLPSQGGSNGIAAPRGMIDLFPMADGSRPTVSNGYDSFKFFLNRDPRFYRTFAFNGIVWPFKKSDTDTISSEVLYTYMWESGNSKYFAGNNNDMASPVVVRKMSANANASNANYDLSGVNIIEYRYAEFLLIMAEAYAGVGNTAKTAEYINKVRERVGAGNIATPSDKYEALNCALYERQVELAYEGKRFWDMQRWLLFNDGGDDVLTTNNTCTKLGFEPLKGHARQGYYLKYTGVVSGSDNPIAKKDLVSVDPNSDNFHSQLNDLAAWYDANFEEASLANALDKFNGKENAFNWNNNFYLSGLQSNLLNQNDWLKQTKGWNDENGSAGTFDFQSE